MTVSVLRLLQGDKRNPSRVLDFTQAGGTLSLAAGGFSPAAGKETVLWSRGQRIDSDRGNAEIKLTYNLREGGSAAELGYWQREVNRFFHEAGLYEEKRQGEPIWLEYRWPDGLADLPAPIFGQLSHYLRILHGEAMWPQDLHIWLRANSIQGVVANLICRPVAEGLRQRVGLGIGQLETGPDGVLVTRSLTNLCTNPSFGHGTWNNGWTAGTNLQATQETRDGFTRSLNSSARLCNLDSVARRFTRTLTLTADDYIVSCYVRRPDGAEPSSDMQIWGQGGARSTTFIQVADGPWYRAYAMFTAAASSSTHGVQIAAGHEVYVDDVQFEIVGAAEMPSAFCAGYLIGCSWAGTAHASNSSRPHGKLRWTLSNELTGQYTAAGWVTPSWIRALTSNSFTIFEYYVDANNYIRIYYDGTFGNIYLDGAKAGVLYDTYETYNVTGRFHVAFTHDENVFRLYVNGETSNSEVIGAGAPPGGTLALGYSTQFNVAVDGYLDGWHLWDRVLSATEILNLYNGEKAVKDVGGVVGMPPFLWNKDGDGVLDNCDDSTRDNLCIIGGIPGDVEALTEWQIDPPTTTPPDVYWLGRKAVEETFDPASTFWLELQGTADANSSGGQYEQHAFGSPGTYDFDVTMDEVKRLQGRIHFLARLYVSGNAVDVNPFYRFGTGPRIDGEVQSVPTNANFLLRAYADWDMWVRWDHLREGEIPSSLRLGLHVSDPTGGATVRCDFVQVLPYPNCRVEIGSSISLSAGDTLHVIEDEAYVLASSGAEKYAPEFRGEPVNLEPHKYNYVWFLAGEEGQQYDITDTATFVVYVTPRWLLPGGSVA